jgi:DNA topoisomerase-1
MEQLHHNGVLVPDKFVGKGLIIKINGKVVKLNELQEERAMAWVKKIGTPYVEDPLFSKNFHDDFSDVLGTEVVPGDIDFSVLHKIVLDEREWRANLSREKRKALAAERKGIREANKEKYGWAKIDKKQMEIGNYTVEPSSIFMGRGKHPMRGKWKEGPTHENIELNLSPDASVPPCNWKQIVWEPSTMWIARWRDKLSGKMKYVWPHDSTPMKQNKDIDKFDRAKEFGKYIDHIKNHIFDNLNHEDIRRRKTATVTFLIDHCKFRVGDEKEEEEEAETIGASTLRPEHLHFNGDGTVTFDFLGKDSVRHYLCVEMPDIVINNLKEFSYKPEIPLFEGVDSKRVSDFLDEKMTGLSAKVFRTYYASSAVEEKLNNTKLEPTSPEYVKKHIATMANLEAAKVCNHKRTIPKSWERSLNRKKERLLARGLKAKENEKKIANVMNETEKKFKERKTIYDQRLAEMQLKLSEYKRELEDRLNQGKSTKSLKKRIASKRKAIKTQKERIKKLKIKHKERICRYRERGDIRKNRDRQAIEKLKLQIIAQEDTKDYNLGTSLKSYVDPRIYFNWGKKVDFDWKKIYSKSLRSKFSWIERDDELTTLDNLKAGRS